MASEDNGKRKQPVIIPSDILDFEKSHNNEHTSEKKSADKSRRREKTD